jgi:hypothetical protein
MRIWTKLIKNDKIIKDNVFLLPKNYNVNKLQLYLSEICNELDVEMPVLLKKHYEHLFYFKSTTFRVDDFIDTPKFDKMVCELVLSDEEKKSKNLI